MVKRITFFIRVFLQKMYVIVFQDEMPDMITSSYDEMYELLKKYPECIAYEYVYDEYWKVGRAYALIDDNDLVYDETGTYACDPDYLSYKFPNQCSVCLSTKSMKGLTCMWCTWCPDCLHGIKKCRCAFDDY